jgi:hypothetical protein
MGRPKGERKPLTEDERSEVRGAADAVVAAAQDVEGTLMQLAVEVARLRRTLDLIPATRLPAEALLDAPGTAYLLRAEGLRRASRSEIRRT